MATLLFCKIFFRMGYFILISAYTVLFGFYSDYNRRICIEATYIYGDRRRPKKLFCREKIEGAGLPDGNIVVEK